MRAVTFAREHVRAANRTLNTRLLYPLNRWFDLHHFTGIIMLFSALSLITQPQISVVKLGALFNLPLPMILAWLFTICGTILIAREVNELNYKKLLLPLYLLTGVSLWYALTGQAGTWAGFISQFTIVGFFWLKSTPKPTEDDDERSIQRD